MSNSKVWDRRVGRDALHSMTERVYLLTITGFVAAGIMFAAMLAQVSRNWSWAINNTWAFIGLAVVTLAVGLFGVRLSATSTEPVGSLVGYALVSGMFGLFLGPLVAEYSPGIVFKSFVLTTALVFVLGAVGVAIPQSLRGWGPFLLGALVALIVGLVIVLFASALGFNAQGLVLFLTWVGIVIFSGLVIYDLNRAMRLQRNVNNAIDVSVAVFLDFINIFIRILSLMGGVKK